MRNKNFVTATLITDKRKLPLFWRVFGARYASLAESLIETWFLRLTNGRKVASWEFYDLSNGGFLMIPIRESSLCVSFRERSVILSIEGAALVTLLLALTDLCVTTGDIMIESRYFQLLEYVRAHSEVEDIFCLIGDKESYL